MEQLVELLERIIRWALVKWPVSVMFITLLSLSVRAWYAGNLPRQRRLEIAAEECEKLGHQRVAAGLLVEALAESHRRKKPFWQRLKDAEYKSR